MYESYNNVIKITRGDSAIFKVNVISQRGGGIYPLKSTDKLVFTVKKSTKSPVPLIQKELINSEIILEPLDTSMLDYGDYVYDVQLTTHKGMVDTIIPPSKFKVLEEVTF